MKNRNLIKSIAVVFALLLSGGIALTGCSNDETKGNPVVKEGVVFNFKRKIIYAATGVDKIGSVKITLSDGTQKIELPSSLLSGDEDLVKTVPFSLAAGNYELTGYKAYDKNQNPYFEVELDSLNEFSVTPRAVGSFTVPVKSREILNQNFIRNALMGLCKQVFGDDETTWPWNPDKYPYPDWEGLEFELDDYNNPMYITGICFDGLKDGKETAWAKMTEVPDGTVSALATVLNLTFTDLPNLKSLPSDLNRFPSLNVITCVNTGLEVLPANLHMISKLQAVTVVGSQLKEVPVGISELSDLRQLQLHNNQISKAELSLTKLTKLQLIDLSYNPLETVSESFIPASEKLVEIQLGNTKLSSLPSAIGRLNGLRSIYLENCQFTSIPAPIKGNTGIKSLHMGGNALTISANDLANMTDLETLSLKGTQLGTLPRLALPNLLMLEVTGCGLTSAPDLSQLPALLILNAGSNKFSTLPSNYFAANPKMRILTLADSPSLTSMPSGNLGLVSKISDTKEGFKYLDVRNCPALTWTTPAAWQCHDDTSKDYTPKGTRRPDIEPGSPYDEYFGRVAVKRTGSSKVTFGK